MQKIGLFCSNVDCHISTIATRSSSCDRNVIYDYYIWDQGQLAVFYCLRTLVFGTDVP